MAVQESRETRTFIAGEDLSSSQFKFVTLEADGQIDLADGDAERCIGVLSNDPASGSEATVVISGKTMVTAGGTVTAGDEVCTDTSGDAVELSTSSSATAITMGYALEDAASGQVFGIELIQGGNSSDQS
jgi:hypothetical protein